MEQIRRAGDRAAALTRQLLAFSRKQVLLLTILDLNAVISELEKMLRRLIGEDIAFRSDLAPQAGNIKFDRGRELAELCDVYCNDAFAPAHRGLASTVPMKFAHFVDHSKCSPIRGLEFRRRLIACERMTPKTAGTL